MEKRTFKQQIQLSKDRHNIKDEPTEIKEPISFVDDLPKERETAIIDLVTLQRLTYDLSESNVKDIVSGFVARLNHWNDDSKKIEDFTHLLDSESAYYKTIKAIIEHNKEANSFI